jgi:hypothetical protein
VGRSLRSLRAILAFLLLVVLLPVSVQASWVGLPVDGREPGSETTVLYELLDGGEPTLGDAGAEVPVGTGTWVPFVAGASPGRRSELLPKSRDTMSVCIDSNFYGMFRVPDAVNQTVFDHLQMPEAGHAREVGKPAVPVLTRFFEIPYGVSVSVELLYQSSQVLDGYYVFPTQQPIDDMPNATVPPFELDAPTYATDAFFPATLATVNGGSGSTPIILRGHRLIAVSLTPVQFNPVTQKVRVYSKIEVRLNYDRPAQVGALPDRLASPAFDDLCAGFILNYRYAHPLLSSALASHAKSSAPLQTGAEYLVITHDDFVQEAQTLADWKEKKGFLTRVVQTSDINPAGPTAQEIHDYIETAYQTWNPVPSYVVLVGDSEFIPVHYQLEHPSDSHGGFDIGTDLLYATVDGDDYFPDLFIGRLSVDTRGQANTVVNKIITYERNPPAAADFYSDVLAAAQFQDDGLDGFEDRRFVLTAEEIRSFLLTQGYTVDRVYCTDPAVTPTNYNDGDYDSGDPLPADLLRANGFAWDGDAADITAAINVGRFLVYHRDHAISWNFYNHEDLWWGWMDGWGDPEYDTTDVAGLANGALLPVVMSIECQSGWFDGEIDQTNDPALTRSFESFCEELLRLANGGAVAAIGATRNSQSGYNDDLIKGCIQAIWPGFDPVFRTGDLFSLGQVLTFGKIYMANVYGYDDYSTEVAFHMFHLFGDPETPIWTAQPSLLTVTHPATIGSGGSQKFVVNVRTSLGAPVDFAKVCLLKTDEIFAVAYTDTASNAYFDVTPATGGSMDITVTKHNFRPYESTITVTANGALLTVTPTQGPSGITVTLTGSNFNGAEQVAIYFGGGAPDTTVPAAAGAFTLTFAVPAGAEGPLNVRAVGQTSNRVGMALFRRLPDQPLPDPYLYCQWDAATWHLNPAGGDPRWDNPDIQLIEEASGDAIASDDLVVGTPYTIRATIHNDATVDATDADVTFQWALWGTGQPSWSFIHTDTLTVPDGSTAIAEADWTPAVTGHVCLLVTIAHPWDSNLDNNRGQENTHVQPVSSPGAFTFTLWNPANTSALIYLEARQVMGGSIWPAQLKRDYPQVQAPGAERAVTVTVTAPSSAQHREIHRFTISAYINDTLIGGIEVDVVVNRAPPTLPPIIIIALGGGILVVAVIAIVVVLRRRKR